MLPVLFAWRGIVLHSFPVMIYAALLTALIVAVQLGQAAGLDPDRIAAAVLLSYVPAFACARALYVARHWDYFREDPIRMLRRSEGGLSLFGLFADGGVFPGGITPFAKGGVPGLSSQITPFANGGLTTGPTLFGLAGEAGTEAIMPLTRIGGKLGVNASGAGGGNHYHITVQAIDTQTGMSFIAKHVDHIEQGLRQRNVLNRK